MGERDEGRQVTYRAGEGDAGKRLDLFLKEKIPRMSREGVKEAIRTRVSLRGRRRAKPSLELKPGDEVLIFRPAVDDGISSPGDETLLDPASILHLDESMVAVNKPGGLLVHGTTSATGPSLLGLLGRLVPGPLHLAHRLDRETSGVVILGRTPEAARILSSAFAGRRVAKTYTAVVFGTVGTARGIIDLPLGRDGSSAVHIKQAVDMEKGQEALTRFDVSELLEGFTVLDVTPRTGRRHQIRVHLKALGHPVVGDKLYGSRESHHLRFISGGFDDLMRRELLTERHLLHAACLELDHPGSGEVMRLEAPLPGDMVSFIRLHRPA